jgi:hypothetical protein
VVQVANAKETKEEKSTDIEDVEISMEENSNTISTSNAGSPMEESSGGSIWVTVAAVANAVVVDVAEEGSSMEEGTSMSTGKLVLSTALRNCACALSHDTQGKLAKTSCCVWSQIATMIVLDWTVECPNTSCDCFGSQPLPCSEAWLL